MRPCRLLIPLLLLAFVPASPAAGDGPPTLRDAGSEGVIDRGSGDRLTALPVRAATVLTRSQTDGGRVRFAALVRGRWGVPVVAYDATSGGLSADGATLILMRPPRTYPRRRTKFAVVDTKRLGLRRTIVLKGEWSFDAISPDGSTVYLVQALSRRDPNRYAVRAYDMRAHRLLPEPIVDRSEPDEPMRGVPVTRTTGPGGRWEYTLYAGGEHPFVHALDTVRRQSICIDLPQRIARSRYLYQLRLRLRGKQVAVLHHERVVASAPLRPAQASTGSGPPWLLAALALTGLVAAAGVRRARRRPSPSAHPGR
jgi:hypothetical protein